MGIVLYYNPPASKQRIDAIAYAPTCILITLNQKVVIPEIKPRNVQYVYDINFEKQTINRPKNLKILRSIFM